MKSGFSAGMAHFIAVVSHEGEFPADFADRPAPDPAMFGMSTEDDGSRDDVLMAQNIITGTHYELDFEALRRASTRIVLALGVESQQIMAGRGATAVAERLGVEPVIFPGGHNGFMGGEYDQPPGEPGAFAAKLREVLAQA
jgi:hypothetical protein